MILRICQQCNKQFSIWPYKIKEGKGKYCSTHCAYTARTGRPQPWISIANKGIRRNPTTEFKKGSIPWNKGIPQPKHSDHYNFKNGKGSYRKHFKRLIPNPYCNHCAIQLSWSSRKTHVHHLNHDRSDGRIENLIILCSKCHLGLHKRKSTL